MFISKFLSTNEKTQVRFEVHAPINNKILWRKRGNTLKKMFQRNSL